MQTPVFLINSRLGRFSAACFSLPRTEVHLPQAPLLPKLRGQFAEFLLHRSLEHLRLLASPTCVRLRYGRMNPSPTRLFSAVCPTTLYGVYDSFGIGARLLSGDLPPKKHLPPCIGNPPPDGRFAPASPLRVKQSPHGTGIFARFPSPTPFGLGLGSD